MGYFMTALALLIFINFAFWLGMPALVPNFSWSMFGSLNDITSFLLSALGYAGLLSAVVVIVGAAISSFSVIYTIPAAVFTFIISFLSAPLTIFSLVSGIMPVEIGALLTTIMSVLIIVAGISFVRGGEL